MTHEQVLDRMRRADPVTDMSTITATQLAEVDELVAQGTAGEDRTPEVSQRTRRSQPQPVIRTSIPGWAVALATASVVLVLIGGAALLIRGGETPGPGDQPVATVPDPEQPVTTVSGATIPVDDEPAPAVQAETQQEKWSLFTWEDGLPVGTVHAVTVARDGTVWAAASQDAFECRLGRFDGEQWTTLEPGPVLEQACVMSLQPAPDGGVMALVQVPTGETEEGLPVVAFRVAEFDGSEWIDHSTTHPLPYLPYGTDSVMHTLDDGRVVVASHIHSPRDAPKWPGMVLFVYDGDTWEVSENEKPFFRSTTAWTFITVDSAGVGWFIEGGPLNVEGVGLGHHVVQLTMEGPIHHQLPVPTGEEDVDYFAWITATPGGDIWASRGTTLHQYDGSGWTTHAPGDGLTPPGDPVAPGSGNGPLGGYAMGFGTADGAFWIIEPSGVSVFRDGSWTLVDAETDPGIPEPVPEHHDAIIQGADGSTWVTGYGIHRYMNGDWERIPVEAGISLGWVGQTEIAIAADGTAWFVTETGVARYSPSP